MAQNPAIKGLRCLKCGQSYPLGEYFEGCSACRTDTTISNLTVVYDYAMLKGKLNRETFANRRMDLWRYQELLPVDPDNAVTLGEGMTPLIPCSRLADQLGIDELYVKDESRNPTWSFKDRLCSVAVSRAREIGAPKITISSTGNHGAATAAYAARAGIPSVIFTLESVPQTMKVLMQSYGAKVVACRTLRDRWVLMTECIRRYGWYPTGTYTYPPTGSNYYGIEGYKTIAYEVVEALAWEVPDVFVLPVAYADGLAGIWKGFKEFKTLGLTDRLPRMVAVEAFGSLGNALKKGLDYAPEVPMGPSVAFSIAVNISTYQGLQALVESKGTSVTITDDEVLAMQQKLGAAEGIYAEQSSVASLVGAAKLRKMGEIQRDERVVCLLTASGLKDTGTTASRLPAVPVVSADMSELEQALKSSYRFSLD